ncbi:hypothetical protein A2773_06120 [Candidatus Gottesmanbacteria bacterium RIFCSPHIGHO2_01_FULL_39_10]|uniref:indole-3-glycerol-phosphate synthase n=1 Tax=Candidatus Gottesmanbacteria bacterium RIFCSPHIGHO2_01_FULL_39_10 TaxID=1798375 RepID=A0A1F5ZLR3_9BACT|nr:MAG: hypothetical protein A2773_06120 [Candidatus Gottesmanbacteria bacterium RIFCSPHIGHO2_01_FULL_39_10]
MVNNFRKNISNPKGFIAIIAEIKLASPSTGRLGDVLDVEKKIKAYEKGGADCISVVVESRRFGGSYELLREVKSYSNLPILCKDFVTDESFIYKAKDYGADAILLIARIVSLDKLVKLVKLGRELGIEPVVEVFDKDDLEKAILTRTNFVAVNARDLDTFKINVDQACKLLRKTPRKFLRLGFSGVVSRKEVVQYKNAGVLGVLVGTILMKGEDPELIIKELKDI